MAGRMSWPAGWAVLCCCRVGDPFWRDPGGEKVMRRCRCCGSPVVTEVRALEVIHSAFPGAWDIACVECYSTNRAPVELHVN